MINAIWSITTELAPWLLLGTLVAALLHIWLPQGLLRRHLSGYGGVAKAVTLGVPLPLCSCGVIPAGIGLKKDGASDGAAVGFLISTPQTGVDSILVSASFLGWPFALFKVVAAGVTGLAGGWMVEATGGAVAQETTADATLERPRTWRDGVDHGLELIEVIWRWLVFGVLVSAALTVWVPTGSLSDSVLGSGPLAILTVLALSIPLYVCATASVPIAASLVAAGLPTGAALVFLMAGPATNVATIGAVNRTFGRRITGIYLATVIVGSAGLGLAFDALWGTTAVAATQHHHESWWASAGAVVLLGLIGWFALKDLRALARSWSTPMNSEDPMIEMTVHGMTCGGCSSRLDGVLRALPGVTFVDVSHDEDRATVRGSVDRQTVVNAVRGAGFQPS